MLHRIVYIFGRVNVYSDMRTLVAEAVIDFMDKMLRDIIT